MIVNCTADKFNDFLLKAYGKRKKAKCENIPRSMLPCIENIATKKLTCRQKECFFLYYKKKQNMKQVADTLNLSAPTVYEHLKRARIKTYKELKSYNEAPNLWL